MMSNNSPNSLLIRAWRGVLVLCGIVVLLTVSVDLVRRIWIDLVVMAGVTALIAVVISALVTWRRRQRW